MGESYREHYRGHGREAGADYARANTRVDPRGGAGASHFGATRGGYDKAPHDRFDWAARPHDRFGNMGEVGSDEGYREADVREEPRGVAPRTYRRSDDRIREEVCEALWDHSAVDASDVEVAVRGGEVELSGTVLSRDEKRAAEDVALAVPGVRDVRNLVRVTPPSRNG